jgi:hypothetical protein
MKLYTGKPHDIDLDAPPDERWAGFARQNGDAIHAILEDVETHVDEEILPHLSDTMKSVVKSVTSGGGRLGSWVLTGTDLEYPQELQCLARHAEVPVGKLLLGNLIYDFTSLAEMYGCGCSSASFDVNSTPVIVRNMDWVTPPSTGKHTKLLRFHRGRKSYTSVGVAGMVGVVSAMSDLWALVVNQAPIVKSLVDEEDEDDTDTGWWESLSAMFAYMTNTAASVKDLLQAWPALHRVRAVCDKMPSYEKLVFHLRTQQTMVPFFAHVVGTKDKEHAVVTHTGEHTYIRTRKHGLVQTNHYVTGELKKHNPENGEDWVWDTYTRYEDLSRACKEETPAPAAIQANPAVALKLLKDVTSTDTMQQMLLWPAQEKLVLKTRSIG